MPYTGLFLPNSIFMNCSKIERSHLKFHEFMHILIELLLLQPAVTTTFMNNTVNILSMHVNLSLCIIWGKLGNPGHHWELHKHTVV